MFTGDSWRDDRVASHRMGGFAETGLGRPSWKPETTSSVAPPSRPHAGFIQAKPKNEVPASYSQVIATPIVPRPRQTRRFKEIRGRMARTATYVPPPA
ncbi:hypothetical protein AcV7_006114 [Taiwanofungus camphoratus]|nr:hypothetical protein AcV7_006114 [Antrodia cinnamomea]